MTRTTDLYYESHVTIDPAFGDTLDEVQAIAMAHGFRVASQFMRKSPDEMGIAHQDDSFMTGRSINREDIILRTQHLVRALQAGGTVVRRYKIEETLCDSNLADPLQLLPD